MKSQMVTGRVKIMFNSSSLLKIQIGRGAKIIGGSLIERDKDWVVRDCRKKIIDNSYKMRGLPPAEKRKKLSDMILQYISDNKPVIDGYKTEDNEPDMIKLREMLEDEIMNYSILTEAMEDPKVYEIRINGKEVKIEKEGFGVIDLMDESGNVLSFSSRSQQETVMRKILGDIRLNPKFAIVNARTADGFRVAAVHHTAISPDPLHPTDEVYNAAVIRKFRSIKMDLNDIVKKRTISDNMANVLSVLAAGGCTFFTVGPTASGKTTTNNAILQAVPADTRTVLLQNPSEIDLRKRDNNGRIYNDVLHLEGREIENPSPYDPTMPNLMDHILRLSPTFVCFGELRADKEFRLGLKIGRAGHPLNATYHAESAYGAVGRFVEAVIADTGMPYNLALSAFQEICNFIIVQKIMRDGTRKVLSITEVVKIDENNSNKIILNPIYEYVFTGEAVYDDETGKVKEIPGRHVRVGRLSARTVQKFRLEGIPLNKYQFLLKDVKVERDENGNIKNLDELEVETYNGDNDLRLHAVGKQVA